jgi:hypothetical protein
MSHEKVVKVADLLRIFSEKISTDLSENPIIIAAEETGNEDLLNHVASVLVTVDSILNKAADGIEVMAEKSIDDLYDEDLEAIVAVANKFDKSDDPVLVRQASVIDQLLMKLNAAEERLKFKEAQDKEIDRLRAKLRSEQRDEAYTRAREESDKALDVKNTAELIENRFKTYRPLETALSTRTCPDHPGAQMARIADTVFQCSMDHKIYNYSSGFTTLKGNKVPGSDVAEQTRALYDRRLEGMSFTDRNQRLSSNASLDSKLEK